MSLTAHAVQILNRRDAEHAALAKTRKIQALEDEMSNIYNQAYGNLTHSEKARINAIQNQLKEMKG